MGADDDDSPPHAIRPFLQCSMCRHFVILAVLSVMLSSCVEHHETAVEPQPLPFAFDESLVLCDSLLQHDADSAMMCLTSLRPTEGSGEISHTFNANYQSLLISEALYKTDNPQYYRSDLQDAMRCFDSLYAVYPANDDLAMLAARSHYMNGVGFYEDDSVVDACREYLKTLEIMEDHFGVETSQGTALQGYKAKFMGLTYGRLGELFSSQFIMEPAIYCTKKLLFYCNIFPTSKYGVSNALYHIGQYYDILDLCDSACFYYKKAFESLPDSNNIIYRDLVSNTTLQSYSISRNAESALLNMKQIIKQTSDEKEKLTRYIVVGYIYYEEHFYDSALFYFEKVFNNKEDDVSRYQPAEYLRNIYLNIGDTLKSNEYSRFLAENVSSKYDNMMNVATIEKMFNDYLEQQKYKQHYKNKKRIVSYIAILSAILVFTTILLIIRNKRKIKEADLKYNEEKAKVKKLKKKLYHQSSEIEPRIESFLNEPVCRKINEMICDVSVSSRCNYSDYTHIKLDEDTVIGLGEAVTRHFPNLKPKLLAFDIDLKKDDLLLCYLYLLGLKDSQIALLRQCHYSTVNRQVTRLKKIWGTQKDLPTFIKKIAVS